MPLPLENLFINEELVLSEVALEGIGTAIVYSSRSPEAREAKNEDAAAVFRLDEESGVLVVADGAGGQRRGEQASSIAIHSMQSALAEAVAGENHLRYGVINAFEWANKVVINLGIGAATTLAVVEVQGDRIRPYHVGDSEILVVGQRGKIRAQIVPHSPVGYAVESGMLDEDAAIHHEDRHIVSNLIGSSDMRIEVGAPQKLSERDTVLLASDGLADNLHTEEIVELIRKGPLHKAAQELAAKAVNRMRHPTGEQPSKPDDLTFILFRLKK